MQYWDRIGHESKDCWFIFVWPFNQCLISCFFLHTLNLLKCKNLISFKIKFSTLSAYFPHIQARVGLKNLLIPHHLLNKRDFLSVVYSILSGHFATY